MFEHHTAPLLSRGEFTRRVLLFIGIGVGIIMLSLGIGIVSYHQLAGLSWVDSLLNASMILGGMGPVDPLTNNTAKVFASLYALFSGTVFLVAVGIMVSPFIHRVLHQLHLEPVPGTDEDGGDKG